MADFLGDIMVGQTLNFTWDTTDTDGASITRGTNGTVSVYKDASATQTTTGVTDEEDDPDTLTGIHQCTIATTDSFYTPGSDYHVILSGAVIDSLTVNATIARFSIQNRYQPGLIARGALQSATATTAVLAAATSFANDLINGATLVIVHGTGKGQSRLITDWVSSSDTASVDTWATTPDSSSYYEVYATPPGSTSSPVPADVRQINSVAVQGAGTSGDKWRA